MLNPYISMRLVFTNNHYGRDRLNGMKVLFVFYVPGGGVETLNRQRWKALQKAGITSHFLYMYEGSGMKNIRDMTVFITNRDHEIKKIIDRHLYDTIIVCSDYNFIQRIKKMGYQGKILYEIQGLGGVHKARTWLNKAKPVLDQNADAIIFPETPHIMTLTKEILPDKKTFTFNNCIDTETFTYRRSKKYAYPIISWVGRLESNKNWRYFLKIAKDLLNKHPTLRLWMFIDDQLSPDMNLFLREVKRLSLSKNLKVFKNIPHDQMPKYYSITGGSGGFLCSTSKSEGSPYCIQEAMSCRCPVLATDSDGSKIFITHNVTGKLVPLNHVKLAVREGQNLLVNQHLREKLKRNAYQFIQTKFSLDQYALQFKKMMYELNN